MMSGRKDKLYTTSAQCFSHIWKEGGIRLLYKGAGMNSIRAIGRHASLSHTLRLFLSLTPPPSPSFLLSLIPSLPPPSIPPSLPPSPSPSLSSRSFSHSHRNPRAQLTPTTTTPVLYDELLVMTGDLAMTGNISDDWRYHQ